MGNAVSVASTVRSVHLAVLLVPQHSSSVRVSCRIYYILTTESRNSVLKAETGISSAMVNVNCMNNAGV